LRPAISDKKSHKSKANGMAKNVKGSSILLAFAFSLAIFSSCTKPAVPTNADIVKAVLQHEQGGSCVVFIPSINILGKEKRKDDGSIPYHLHYKCMGKAMTPKNENRDYERDVVLNMYQTRDNTGATLWLAR
jgi:hypothetical protein